ncbi:hypothetical protein HaLaN_10736 [Haematococcus lacustris]|uniref:Uncharacterized protein n=1 Tax=Haematococcus lacustris TaxID=44745 RepID=A0A699Z694_HAELA|nr:hypothetical protein HaLaN_10736 [Haematococcus lacustris]
MSGTQEQQPPPLSPFPPLTHSNQQVLWKGVNSQESAGGSRDSITIAVQADDDDETLGCLAAYGMTLEGMRRTTKSVEVLPIPSLLMDAEREGVGLGVVAGCGHLIYDWPFDGSDCHYNRTAQVWVIHTSGSSLRQLVTSLLWLPEPFALAACIVGSSQSLP